MLKLTIVGVRNNAGPIPDPASMSLDDGAIHIGRASDNDWTLPDQNRTMSRKHCTVMRQREHYVLIDHSLNGVRLENQNETLGKGKQIELNDGDLLGIGDFQVRVEIPPAARTIPPTTMLVKELDPEDVARASAGPNADETAAPGTAQVAPLVPEPDPATPESDPAPSPSAQPPAGEAADPIDDIEDIDQDSLLDLIMYGDQPPAAPSSESDRAEPPEPPSAAQAPLSTPAGADPADRDEPLSSNQPVRDLPETADHTPLTAGGDRAGPDLQQTPWQWQDSAAPHDVDAESAPEGEPPGAAQAPSETAADTASAEESVPDQDPDRDLNEDEPYTVLDELSGQYSDEDSGEDSGGKFSDDPKQPSPPQRSDATETTRPSATPAKWRSRLAGLADHLLEELDPERFTGDDITATNALRALSQRHQELTAERERLIEHWFNEAADAEPDSGEE